MSPLDSISGRAIEALLDDFVARIEAYGRGPSISGLTDHEIDEIRVDQKLASLPDAYVGFLRRVGRSAGRFLRGTDAFYPAILGLKPEASVLMDENGVTDLYSSDSLVIGMHQGYQLYWMNNPHSNDPPVDMYQEGDLGVKRHWNSFTEFLLDQSSRDLPNDA